MIDPQLVATLIRRTAEAVILPRFGTLTPAQIREKKPGDLVTVADTEAEAMLAGLLTAALPGSVVCGEEGVARDRATLDLLQGTAPVWVIDPVDGTANFARGREGFATIVALVEQGVTTAGWIHDPLGNITIHAALGGGAWCGGRHLQVARDLPLSAMTGSAYGRIDAGGGESGRRLTASGTVAAVCNTGCGGIDYILMARGAAHFKFSSASLPWDHAAGILILQEAGAAARFFDGSPYSVHVLDGHILIAPTEDSWDGLHRALAPPATAA